MSTGGGSATVRDASLSGTDDVGCFRLRWAATSDVGHVREANEDGALVGARRFFVADGMGGHEGGEIASFAALDALAECAVDTIETARASIVTQLGSAKFVIDGIEAPGGRAAGTTITGLVAVAGDEPLWLVVNIGDSRTYRLGAAGLTQLTVDHSTVQELVDAGFLTKEQARTDPRRNVITRALGAGMEPEADFRGLPIVAGDRLLVCSDGLTGEVDDEAVGRILASDRGPAAAAAALLEAALAGGGRDNVTLVVIDVERGDDAD